MVGTVHNSFADAPTVQGWKQSFGTDAIVPPQVFSVASQKLRRNLSISSQPQGRPLGELVDYSPAEFPRSFAVPQGWPEGAPPGCRSGVCSDMVSLALSKGLTRGQTLPLVFVDEGYWPVLLNSFVGLAKVSRTLPAEVST